TVSTARSSFFFQAEDGIRDSSVTGVQTCALPISPSPTIAPGRHLFTMDGTDLGVVNYVEGSFIRVDAPLQRDYWLSATDVTADRSEERRVGKGRKRRVSAGGRRGRREGRRDRDGG